MRSGEALTVRVGAIAAGLVLALTTPAAATTIVVETDVDEFGAGGTSACTLREAVEAARTNDSFGGCAAGSDKDRIEMPGSVVLQRPEAGGTNAGGDLDYNANEKLTIIGAETFTSSPPQIDVAPAWSDRVLEATKGTVTLRGIEISDIESGEAAGGAVLATGANTALKMQDVVFHDNSALDRGGAVACEFCKSLDVSGNFQFFDNSIISPETPLGGAIFSTAPTVIEGQPFPDFIFGSPRFFGNTATPGVGNQAHGGAVMVFGADLTITNTVLNQNEAEGEGAGGAISMLEPADGPAATMKLTDVTLEDNAASGRGGAIEIGGFGADETSARLVANRIAVLNNVGVEAGGGLFTLADAKITESVFQGNTLFAAGPGSGAQGGGIFAGRSESNAAKTVSLSRTSVTNNQISGGAQQLGGGVYAAGVDLSIENSTLSGNSAPVAESVGGGLSVEEEDGDGSVAIAFSTFRENVAGIGASDGDAIAADMNGRPVSIKASIIDEGSDGCTIGTSTDIESGGFNVADVTDPDCGLDRPTDSDGADLLNPLGPNGSPPVGVPGQPPFTPVTIPLTNAFTDDSSAAHDIVPPNKCKVGGKSLKTDARGVPRPQRDGCDAGAVELTGCNQSVVAGPDSYVGRKSVDQIQGGFGADDTVLALGGDDFITTYSGQDFICAGGGDDIILPQADSDDIAGQGGTDYLSYNNAMAGGITADLEEGTVTGPSIGSDFFSGIESFQGSEDDDTILGSGGKDFLVGGGDPDEIRGRGGIDVIDAKDGDADVLIDCGPGDNSKEKAKIDQGLDPDPVSC